MNEEHKKLKEICDKIWFKTWSREKFWIDWDWISVTTNWAQFMWNRDVREIIFTSAFLEKYFKYLSDTWVYKFTAIKIDMIEYCDNVVEYLHTLLFTEWQNW